MRKHKCKSPKQACINAIMKHDFMSHFLSYCLVVSKNLEVSRNGDASIAVMDQSIAKITLWTPRVVGGHLSYLHPQRKEPSPKLSSLLPLWSLERERGPSRYLRSLATKKY